MTKIHIINCVTWLYLYCCRSKLALGTQIDVGKLRSKYKFKYIHVCDCIFILKNKYSNSFGGFDWLLHKNSERKLTIYWLQIAETESPKYHIHTHFPNEIVWHCAELTSRYYDVIRRQQKWHLFRSDGQADVGFRTVCNYHRHCTNQKSFNFFFCGMRCQR